MSGTGPGDDREAKRAATERKLRPRRDSSSPVGRALRTVYDETVREAVPDDFLDLLKKLD